MSEPDARGPVTVFTVRDPGLQAVAESLLEALLQLIESGTLLRNFGLHLRLNLGHTRADRRHLVVDERVHLRPQLTLGRRDFFAYHRPQPCGDRLIEIRPHRELGMVQRPRNARLDFEIRNPRDGAPDQAPDQRVGVSRVSRPA